MSENTTKMIRLRVKEVCEEKHISMTKLFRISNISYNTIRNVFNHPERPVSTDTLEKFSKALNVPVSELMEQLPDAHPTSQEEGQGGDA